MSWRERGKDPDYRFSLANERTFLAWIRTALAILAGAIILREFVGSGHAPRAVGALSEMLAVLAGIIGAVSYFRWRNNELAMRLEQSLPASALLMWVAAVVALLGAGSAIWLFAEQL